MRLVRPDHDTLDVVYPGIRQDHAGQCYREGRLLDGEAVMVDASDSRTFKLSDGTFTSETLNVLVTDGDQEYVAGNRPGPGNPAAEPRKRTPRSYVTRDKHGLHRLVEGT